VTPLVSAEGDVGTGSRSTYNQLNDECFIKTAVNQWVCETLYIDGGYHIID
jgi:hypothetical protein